MNNPLSFSSARLDLFSKVGDRLKPATGFVIEADKKYYLITNWHVVSGKDMLTGKLLESSVAPAVLKVSLHLCGSEGENNFPVSWGVRKKMEIQLYDDNHTPKWIEISATTPHKPIMDIVALPIQLNLSYASLLSERISEHKIKMNYWLSSIPISAIHTDVEYGPPDTVHIIGYPLNWAPSGTEKSSAAFWRTSSIASEIHEVNTNKTGSFFVDPSALEGMTGSPVVGMKNNQIKLLGVYSDASTAEFGANAGLVWDAFLIKDLIGMT